MTHTNVLSSRPTLARHHARSTLMVLGALSIGCGSPASSDDAGSSDLDTSIDAVGADAPSEVRLYVNEVSPANHAGCTDEAGEADDWIELYNAGEADVLLDGYAIGERIDDPFSGLLAGGLVVPAHGHLLLWADDDTEQGAAHLPFKLSAEGESAILFAPSRVVLDQLSWTNARDDEQYARIPDGTGEFRECASASCGTSNGTSCTPLPDAGPSPDDAALILDDASSTLDAATLDSTLDAASELDAGA